MPHTTIAIMTSLLYTVTPSITVDRYDVNACPSFVALQTSESLCLHDGQQLPNPTRGEVQHLINLTDDQCNYSPFADVAAGTYDVLYLDDNDELKVVSVCLTDAVDDLYVVLTRMVRLFDDGFESGDSSNWHLTYDTN